MLNNNRKRPNVGFTLIEIMVVVVIISILMGAVAMSIPRDINDQFKEQADRFRVLLRLSQDEAILQSREFAIGFTETGYAFFQLNDNAWQPKTDGPFKPRGLPANLVGELVLEGVPIVLSKKVKPQVFVFSSGEVTPFVYQILFPSRNKSIRLEINPLGEVKQKMLGDE